MVTLYIDGRKIGTLPAIDFTASYKHTYLEVDISNLDNISGGIDVRIQDIVIAKHIPLMEMQPMEAIKNNILGLLNVATLAEFYRIPKFVFVSSNIAVYPKNVLGL